MTEKESVRCAGLMTAGRYENARARNHIEQAFRQAGIPLTVSLGVYYHQCMQMMMEDTLAAGPVDFIITVDGDSFITRDDILRLLQAMVTHPELDAIAAIQCKRGENQLLAGCDTTREAKVGADPILVDTAHFGLTVIRAESLRATSLPWFQAIPNDEGRWGEGRIDADIWFWQNWGYNGKTVAIHPHVRIGHLEEMVAVYDENMELRHIYPSDWERIA